MTDEQRPADYERGYTGHGRGVVVTNDGSGNFSERPMTAGELAARDPAWAIGADPYEFLTNGAAFVYIRAWEIIAPAIDAAIASRDAEIERLRTAERQLSGAYIRLRALIPGAFDTPHGPSPEEVWAHTEAKLAELARLRAQPAAVSDEQIKDALAEAERHNEQLRRDAKVDPALANVRIGEDAQPAADDVETSAAREPGKVERHPGPWVGPDAELARAAAMAVIPWYGDDDEATHQRILRDGVWNDHVAVQAALATIHHLKTVRDRELTAARQDARRQALATGPRWRHKKRGTTYTVIGEASAQVVGEPICEGGVAVVYQSDKDGTLWLRPRDEFYDGRFEPLDSGLAEKPAATSPDIISLVRAYRRAVEASPVSNVLDLQEWRDLCAAMNAIDAAEGAR